MMIYNKIINEASKKSKNIHQKRKINYIFNIQFKRRI